MANTTNYNWETPDDTDLVKDGAAAIRTLGNSIDTTTKNLNPETTTGDIAYRSATANTNTRLAIGTTGQVLTVAAGVPSWATPTDQTPLTTKGDVFTFSTVDARLGVGANGTVLTADSAETTGLKWATPAAGGWTLLSTTTLSGATTTLTVSSGYKKIVLWMTDFYVAAGGAFCGVQINGNGSNYTNWYPEIGITANNVNYAGYFTAGGSQIEVFPSGMAQSNMDGVCVIELDAPDETNMQKTYRAISRYTNSASSSLAYNTTGIWRDSTAITTLAVKAGNSTWSGGTAYLYGVK